MPITWGFRNGGSLRGAKHLAERAINRIWTFVGFDLSGHVDEALELLWVVGRRLGSAGHAENIMSDAGERKLEPLVLCSEEELERCAAIFEVRYVNGIRTCVGPRRGRNAEPLPQQLVRLFQW